MKNIKKLDEKIEKIINKEIDYKSLSSAENLILISYDKTKDNLSSENIVIESIVWEKDYEDLLKEIKKYNIQKITICDTSTALMGLMYFLISNGCTLEDTEIVEEKGLFGRKEKGLIVKIKY